MRIFKNKHRQHPNNLVLVGKKEEERKFSCKGGVCTTIFKTNESAPTVLTLQDIGIQCCKKQDIQKVLENREKCRIDPFNGK